MRVLITNTGPWGTGSGTVADGVMQELIKRGHEVLAFFPDSGLHGPGYEQYYGQPDLYHIVPFPVTYKGIYLYTFPLIIPDPNPRNFKGAWTFQDLSQSEFFVNFSYIREEMAKTLAEFCPDVVECQHIWAFDHIVGDLGYNYVSVAHHSDQMGFQNDSRMRFYAKESAKKASYIFSISDFVRLEVMDLYKVDPEKVITITNGYDQSVFYSFNVDRLKVLSEFGLSGFENLPVITFCGKISHTKGIDILLQANTTIQREKRVLLLIMGCGDLESFSQEEREKFCLENVVLLGHRSPQDLALLHNIAHVSVLPSRSEGFGISALEAMGCAIPVVTTHVGGLPSFVVGEMVEPKNPEALAASILKLMELPEKVYKELCKHAFETARRYSWSSIVDKRIPYYEKVARLNQKKNNKTIQNISG